MVIAKNDLQKAYDSPNFKYLYFRANNNFRFLFRDKVALPGYIVNNDMVTPLPITTLGKEDKTLNNKEFTSYFLSKAIIDSILLKYGNNTNVVYFLIRPISGDKRRYPGFIYYEVVAADINHDPLQVGFNNNSINRTSSLRSSREEFTDLVVATLDPSPPADAQQ